MPGYVQHFTHAGNDKIKCRYCQEDIKFTNSHLHSSNLRNHLTFKHPEKLSVPEKVPANFRIHKTLANLILKVVVSEACVERAFSRHKLFHSNLRANLKAEKLDEQLFLRYNFQNMIDTASTVNQSHGESDDDDDFCRSNDCAVSLLIV